MTKTTMVGFFSKHLIGLAVTFQPIGEDAIQSEIFSGCLIEFSDQIFLLSSGHNIPYLKEIMQLPGDKTFSLVDYFGSQAKHHTSIPFLLTLDEIIHVDNTDLGLDFCLIHLSEFYMRLLRANGVEVIRKKDWISIRPEDITVNHFLLGFPSSLFTNGYKLGSFGAQAVITSVERVSDEEASLDGKFFPRFVGKLNPDFDISPKGMSGGPIFGMSLDGKKYWIVAIQSEWRKSESKIFGCHIPVLALLVEKALRV
jgi:hypothetical protein